MIMLTSKGKRVKGIRVLVGCVAGLGRDCHTQHHSHMQMKEGDEMTIKDFVFLLLVLPAQSFLHV